MPQLKNFRFNVILRVVVLAISLLLLFYIFFETDLKATFAILSIIVIIQLFSLIRYVDLTNRELAKFFLSIKYSDFSQSFMQHGLGSSFKELENSFNNVMQQFQKTRGEKEENLKYLQTVMQHVGVGLISFDQDGKVEYINSAAKKILKVTYLTNLEQLNKIDPDLGDNILNLNPGTKKTIKIPDEDELVQIVFHSTEYKMRGNKYTLISLQNIHSELEEKEMEAWQKLIRVLTHEIMNSVTPISSLAGTVNTLLDDPANLDDEIADVKSAVKTIQKRSEGLIHFVENYRNLTKIPKPNFETFRVSVLIERIHNLMKNELAGNNINFSSSIAPDNLTLSADSELIEQVIINLLLNAKYAIKNIQKPEISIRSYTDDRGKVIIRIEDNGPGISKEIQDKIFIPFYTTKKDGSGIGLSLSRQIMRSHFGSITVVSKEGEGTAFVLRF
jgi:two-component system nitrogen regulation sensor histidine kinase NtrY